MAPRTPFLLWLFIFIHRASCEDFITGTVAEFGDVQSGIQSMPENVSIHMTIGGQDLQLDLKVDRNASLDIPVYVFSRNNVGQLETKRIQRNREKEFAVYRDVKHGAVFGARRDVETGQGQLSLDGMLQVQGKFYDLKSSKRRYQNRNSTTHTVDGKASSERRDVKRRDTRDQNEAGGQHEFAVRLQDDLPLRKLTADAIPPPAGEKKQVKAKTSMGDDNRQPLTASSAVAAPASGQQTMSSDVYIDVVAVADYGVFSIWHSGSSAVTKEEKTQDVFDKLHQYYASLFSGVNMLYESILSLPYNIHVRLSAIIISTDPADSPWTDSIRVMTSPRDLVDSHQALTNLWKWAASTDILPSYDHLALFSGYDIFNTDENSTINKNNLGLAYVGTMCSQEGLSCSIVEDLQSFQSIFTTAHEMGHSLSAQHDGLNNSCQEEDRYIMAAIFSPNTASDRHNLWQFSTCSVRYFDDLIRRRLIASPGGQQCLYNTITPDNYIPDVSGQQPGQVYDYDDQCRQVYGPSSRMCRASNFLTTPAEICMHLYCDKLGGTCSTILAARGTSCGNGKWCVDGDCVSDSRAPAMDDRCPFGDLPGYFWNTNQTCAELTDTNPRNCYDDSYFIPCCSSCAKYYRPVTNCEYGDRATNCAESLCSSQGVNYLSACCGTCHYGTPITTASTTGRITSSVTSTTSTAVFTTSVSTPSVSTTNAKPTLSATTSQSTASFRMFTTSAVSKNDFTSAIQTPGGTSGNKISSSTTTDQSAQHSAAAKWWGFVMPELIGWVWISTSLLNTLFNQ